MPMQNYRLIAAVFACALIGVTGAGVAEGQQDPDPYCSGLLPPGIDRPPNTAHTGRYVNAVYGYAVTIPPGLTAYSGVTGPERGFWIVLSGTPRGYLRVDAAYDAFYDITADGVHRRDVIGVQLYDTLLSDQNSAYSVAHNPGGRYLTRVQCGGKAPIYVHDDVIVVRNREIYRLDLQSVPGRHATDTALLDALLRTWSWVPIRH